MSFRVGDYGCRMAYKEIGSFTEEDFYNLPKSYIYLRLIIDGIAVQTFLLPFTMNFTVQ